MGCSHHGSRLRSRGRAGVIGLALAVMCLLNAAPAVCAADVEPERADMLVYGATPAGVAAARAAALQGHAVVLIEPTQRIGGMTTNGLSHPDFRTLEGVTGTYRQLVHDVVAHYRQKYGDDPSRQLTDFYGTYGTHAEPHVNLMVFQRRLDEADVRVLTDHHLTEVTTKDDDPWTRITSASFIGPDDTPRTFTADMFIDATYEGDLMAAADVPYRIGREARSAYDEPLAPQQADGRVQGYNFRLIMTDDSDNRVMPRKPEGYDREDYLPLLPFLEPGKLETVFCRWSGCIYKRHEPALPNRKFDMNDVSNSPYVRLSLPEINDDWPDGDRETRQRIYQEHVRHNVGMMYFLQNDEAVPEPFREQAREYGWPKDEFVDSDHLPVQLYVREARRMVGRYVYTQADTEYAADDEARARFHPTAIAMGDYGLNCHGTAREGARFGGRHTGEFYQATPPYQVPYEVLVPKDHANLLVPVAASSSHVGFAALRFEPLWALMGEAAGNAAAVAMEQQSPVQRVPVAEVQRRLHESGAATIYVSDVLPESDDFAAVQWWAMQGALHGIEGRPESGARGPSLDSQYRQAFPAHAARLDATLEPDLHQRWLALAEKLELPTDSLAEAETRGDFIRQAFTHARQQR